jgi:hypothetical protein
MNLLPRATDFTDLTQHPAPKRGGPWVSCPLCHGYGRWNLELNIYGPTSTLRHFQAICDQCNELGYVIKDSKDHTCLHTFREMTKDEKENDGSLAGWLTRRCILTCADCGAKRGDR